MDDCGLLAAVRLRRAAAAAAEPWRADSARLVRLLGIRGIVPVLVTDRLPVPATLGWRRPVILIPCGLEASDSVADRDAVLLHELAHVKRGDALWQCLLQLVGAVYWCHPLAWLLSREVALAWGAACDSVCAFYLGPGRYGRKSSNAVSSP